jgi:hypothetical protein
MFSRELWRAIGALGLGDMTLAEFEALRHVLPRLAMSKRGAA